ncbi:MAG: glycine-rich protein, partial [Acidimicrobiales bacterium]
MRRHSRRWGALPLALLTFVSATVLTAVVADAPAASAAGTTYMFSNAEKTYTVPPGVSSVTITAVGAPGGTGFDPLAGGLASPGGDGATVTATVPVTPGQTLFVEVGGQGSIGPCYGGSTAAAFNGGGIADCGGGGGGASDVRTCSMATCPGVTPDTRLVVAGGGGGGGGQISANGGTGGTGGTGGDATATGAGNGGNGCDGSCTAGAGANGGLGDPFGTGGPGSPDYAVCD